MSEETEARMGYASYAQVSRMNGNKPYPFAVWLERQQQYQKRFLNVQPRSGDFDGLNGLGMTSSEHRDDISGYAESSARSADNVRSAETCDEALMWFQNHAVLLGMARLSLRGAGVTSPNSPEVARLDELARGAEDAIRVKCLRKVRR
jgi:hypothetical protein